MCAFCCLPALAIFEDQHEHGVKQDFAEHLSCGKDITAFGVTSNAALIGQRAVCHVRRRPMKVEAVPCHGIAFEGLSRPS